MKNNLMMIIVGPSGVGKSTLLDRLVDEHDFIEDIITCTTRPMREGESEGHPYHFFTYKKLIHSFKIIQRFNISYFIFFQTSKYII